MQKKMHLFPPPKPPGFFAESEDSFFFSPFPFSPSSFFFPPSPRWRPAKRRSGGGAPGARGRGRRGRLAAARAVRRSGGPAAGASRTRAAARRPATQTARGATQRAAGQGGPGAPGAGGRWAAAPVRWARPGAARASRATGGSRRYPLDPPYGGGGHGMRAARGGTATVGGDRARQAPGAAPMGGPAAGRDGRRRVGGQAVQHAYL